MIERLTTIPGVDRKIAQVIIAEIGIDMSRFPTAGHLASCAGLAPDKNRSSRTLKANRTCAGGACCRAFQRQLFGRQVSESGGVAWQAACRCSDCA